jgi:hypothetical protein
MPNNLLFIQHDDCDVDNDGSSELTSFLDTEGRPESTPTPTPTPSTPSYTPRKRQRLSRRAPAIWKHSRPHDSSKGEAEFKDGRTLWWCKYCHNPPYSSISTTNSRHHMLRTHSLRIQEDERAISVNTQRSIQSAMAATSAQNSLQQKVKLQQTFSELIDWPALLQALVSLVTCHTFHIR